MKKMEDVLASVVLLAEDTGTEHTKAAIENVLQQSHQNLEIIVTTLFDDADLKKFYDNNWKVKFQDAVEGVEFISKAIGECTGDVIFYKTVTNVLWFPNHIKAHLEDFRDNAWKNKWQLSHVEIRDEKNPDHPLNTIGYRIENPPPIDKIILDEIVHLPDATPDWVSCVITEGDKITFIPGNALVEWHKREIKGTIPNEITVVQWVKSGADKVSEEEIATRIGLPAVTEVAEENVFDEETGDVGIKRKIPTIVGNTFLDEQYNNGIRSVIKETKDVKTIGVKRTMGIGDVVLTEPIIRKLKNKYPDAKVILYTAKPVIVNYFETKPDETVEIEDNQLTQDYLSTTDNDLKYDLDLSYESRTGKPFIDSYFETIGIEVDHEDKIPKLIGIDNKHDSIKIPDKKYAVVVGDGSGWIGKTWDPAEYIKVVQFLLDDGYEVVEPGVENYSGLTDKKWNKAEFSTLVKLLNFCDLYVGGDNGPMHIASGFNRKRVLIAGAALPYFTNPNREGVFYVQDNSLDCLGCKHKQFFGTNGQQITFIPNCVNEDKGLCMKTLKAEHVIGAINKINDHPLSMIDNETNLNFMLNIPGWSYYKDEALDLIQREKLGEHPDQDKDISEEYADRWNDVYKDHALPLVKRIKEMFPDKKRLLDVGCNMGIFVKAARDEGFQAFGVDINKASVKRAHETFPELEEMIIDHPGTDTCCNLGGEALKLYDVVVANQVLEHMSDPIDFMKSIRCMLDNDGALIIGCPAWEETGAQELWHKWGSFGTGEHTWIPTEKSFAEVCKKSGFKYTLIEDIKKGLLATCQKAE